MTHPNPYTIGDFPMTTADSVAKPDAWWNRARCMGSADRNFDPFYPTSAEIGRGSDRAAKAICKRCPVQGECLADALERQDEFGIYGGTTPDERAAMQVTA